MQLATEEKVNSLLHEELKSSQGKLRVARRRISELESRILDLDAELRALRDGR